MSRSLFLLGTFCVSVAAVLAEQAIADDIEFHSAAYSFPSRIKTPKEFADVNPDRMIIETSIRVSATFNIAEGEVDRIEYRLKMPEGFEISDYLPKTTVGSEIAGPIGVGGQDSKKSLTVVSLDAGAKAGFKIPFIVEGEVGGKGGYGNTTTQEVGSSVQMSLLPPKQLVTAASTQNEGRTLHFKLKQFNQITLEGDKDFAILTAVPKDWKGECFTLECTAFLKGAKSPALRKDLMIGLYLGGDLTTKKRLDAKVKEYHRESSTITHVTKRPIHEPIHEPAKSSAIDPFRKKYAGKYSVYLGNFVTYHINMNHDGTYEAKGVSSITGATSTSNGVWSATDDKLVITIKHEKCAFYDMDFNLDLINSPIISFDPVRRMIRTKSDFELKPE